MFFQVEVLQCPTAVQKNWVLPIQVARVAEHNVLVVASCQKLIRVLRPVLLD
jgi:hypothetical protein